MVTKTLNLSAGLGKQSRYQCVGFESSVYPQGEQYIKLKNYEGADKIRINSRCNSSDDLVKIIMAVGAIRHNCDTKIELFIPYLPYSRQDRVCSKGEAFSLKIIADIFNNLNLDEIITYDPHSNVAEILFDKLTVISNDVEVRNFVRDIGYSEGREGKALICPDAGAAKKTQWLYQNLPHIFDTLVYCNKVRRPDGGITIGDIKHNIRGMDVLVVDDICDGGATFIELGKRLEEAHVKSASLFVSHGIFSNGVSGLCQYYKHMGTTDSIHSYAYCILNNTYVLDY
jgi:ribose-phosphate pyrophosphokinase